MRNCCATYPFRDPLASHLVQDETTGDWTIIAPGRAARLGPAGKPEDPFAPRALEQREDIQAVYGRRKFKLWAIKNIYPIFHEEREIYGRHEILVEGPDKGSFAGFDAIQAGAVLSALQDRFRALRKDKKIAYIVAFKNEGVGAGASQPHPHSQILGVPFVPDRLRAMARRRQALQARSGKTAHAALLERVTKERTVYADKHAIAFCHPAGRFAYEARVTTRRDIDSLANATPQEIKSLGKALHALLPLVKKMGWPFNFHTHDVIDETDECFEIRFMPRKTVWAGFELDAGIAVNPVPAEMAAGEYRKMLGVRS